MLDGIKKWISTALSGSFTAKDPGPWRSIFGSARTDSGEIVGPEQARRLATVYACCRVRAETLATMPCKLYQYMPDGSRDVATSNGLYHVLHRAPNRWQTPFEFFELMMWHLDLRGNFLCKIIPGYLGGVTELVPLHPDRIVRPIKTTPNGRLLYEYMHPNGETERLIQDEVFHVRASGDGVWGESPISVAANMIGLTLATEKHGAALFKNGTIPGPVFSTDKPMTTDQAKGVLNLWNTEHKGAESHYKAAILPYGLKPSDLGLSNVEAQFLETRKYQRSEICGIFRVPPHMIADLERATFSNIEHSSLEFIQYTMLPPITRVQQAIWRDLIDDENYYAEFLVLDLLRGDSASQAEYVQKMIQTAVMSPNEARRALNLNSMGPSGDKFFFPQNFTTIDKVGVVEKPPEPTQQPVADPPNNDNQPPQSQSSQVILDIMRESLARMISMEKEAVLRASRKSNFVNSVDQWYAEHENRLAEAIRLPFGYLEPEKDVKTAAKRYISQAKEASLSLADGSADELEKRVSSHEIDLESMLTTILKG